MARPAPPSLGFQDDTALMGPNQAAELDRIKRAHGRDIRMNVIYGKLKAEGWGGYDQLVNAARARGLRPQVTLMGTPGYSPQWDQALNPSHNDPRVWQGFANEVAKHFRGRVGRYSIGNEQNIDTFQAGAGKNPLAAGRQYRGIYRAGRAGVLAADPRAQTLLGEITSSSGAKNFLRGVLGGKKPIVTSGLAFHPYDQPDIKMRKGRNPYNTWDIDTLTDLQGTLARYKRQGRLQTAKGNAAPLYLTEFGYSAGGGSTGKRAAKMARAYRLAQQAGARQFLSYQIAPTARKTVQDPATADAYGNLVPGATRAGPRWVWDTSLDPGALAAAIRRPKKASARARAARKR